MVSIPTRPITPKSLLLPTFFLYRNPKSDILDEVRREGKKKISIDIGRTGVGARVDMVDMVA